MIATIVRHQRVAAGCVLFRQGRAATKLHVVLSGLLTACTWPNVVQQENHRMDIDSFAFPKMRKSHITGRGP